MSEEFDRCQPHVTLTREGCDLVDLAEQIVMRRFEVDSERAHTLLVRAAHVSRTKLFDMCTTVCDMHFHRDDGGVQLRELLAAAVQKDRPGPDPAAQLEHLAELRDAGFLTQPQYEARCARVPAFSDGVGSRHQAAHKQTGS